MLSFEDCVNQKINYIINNIYPKDNACGNDIKVTIRGSNYFWNHLADKMYILIDCQKL